VCCEFNLLSKNLQYPLYNWPDWANKLHLIREIGTVLRITYVVLMTSALLAGCVLPMPLSNPEPTLTQPAQETEIPAPSAAPSATVAAAFTAVPTKVISIGPTSTTAPAPTVSIAPAVTPAAVHVPDYVLQAGSPAWLSNFAHPDLGCNFLGIAGQVFDKNRSPAKMLVVEVGGSLAGRELFALSLTGNAPAFGPAGYEIQLADEPLQSTGSIWIQLFNLEGNPLSDKIFFNTFADCDKNLVLINFVATIFPVPELDVYLPAIYKNYNE
jgi:hypothetical protein